MPLNDKIPPQNIEAEKSVLGSMLIEQEAIGKVIELLKEDNFYKDSHKKIFSAMVNLFDKNQPADLITVSEELSKKNQLELTGGVEYLTELINTVPTAANVEYYSGIVREKSALRDLITVSTNIVTEAFNENAESDGLLDKAERMIFSISERRIKPGFIKLKDVIHKSIQKIEELSIRETLVTGLPSDFERLDEMTTGFHPGELIIVAARPSMGKTAFCLTVAQSVAIKHKIPVAIFSLEMSVEQLNLRMLCSEARVDLRRVRSGRIYKEDWPRLTTAASLLSEAPIYVDDSSTMSALEIKAKTRRLKMEVPIGLVVVDYLQLMEGSRGSENRQQEISTISRNLKGLAKELDVPVIVVSQLSRGPERQEKQERRPMLSHLRDSGAIEQDADVVLFLYREVYYNREMTENRAKTELIIAKQRNGPIGKIDIAFTEEYARFDNLAFNAPPEPGEEVHTQE